MKICASQWKEAQVGGNDRRPDLAAVSGAMPCEPERRRRADLSDIRSRARRSVWLPLPMVAAVGSHFRAGVECRRAFGRPKRHETMREPMERGQGGRNDRQPDLAAVSGAMPCEPTPCGRAVVGDIRSGAGAGACPNARACLSVRLAVPMVATVGSRIRLALGPAARRIHDRAPGARPVPVRHRRMGQYADAHLPLLGNPLLWAYAQGRLYVRG